MWRTPRNHVFVNISIPPISILNHSVRRGWIQVTFLLMTSNFLQIEIFILLGEKDISNRSRTIFRQWLRGQHMHLHPMNPLLYQTGNVLHPEYKYDLIFMWRPPLNHILVNIKYSTSSDLVQFNGFEWISWFWIWTLGPVATKYGTQLQFSTQVSRTSSTEEILKSLPPTQLSIYSVE